MTVFYVLRPTVTSGCHTPVGIPTPCDVVSCEDWGRFFQGVNCFAELSSSLRAKATEVELLLIVHACQCAKQAGVFQSV